MTNLLTIRCDITQDDAITAIVAHLRTALDLDETHCYEVESDDFAPKIPIGGSYWLTVAADEGRFPQEEQVAGNITEEGGFIVSGWTRIQLDPTDHAFKLLHDNKRGLLIIKRKILSAICGADPPALDGTFFLRQTLYAIRATRPSTWTDTEGKGIKAGKISVTFGLDFDWNLETPVE